MDRQDKLRERYEDDLLALLMDSLLEEEGQALLEEIERLNADPDAAIPAGLDKKCRALLQSAFPDKPIKKPKWMTGKILKRVLIAAVLAATMLVTAYAAVPEFRVGVLNLFLEIKEYGTYFFFYSNEANTPAPALASSGPLIIKDGMPFKFSYVPDGYELFRQEAVDFGANGTDFYCGYYCTAKEAEVYFEITPISEGTRTLIDTEDATITDINIHGYEGQLIEKIDLRTGKECFMYLWFDLDNRLMFYYSSHGIPFEESQRIFDGIVIYE